MKNPKSKTKKGSETDQALAKVGELSPDKGKINLPPEISLDTVIAEKDEVKNAEERMRQQVKEEKKR
ncbi:MAG: hypothetical protein ACYCZO_07975 [Daejeonella sp.]